MAVCCVNPTVNINGLCEQSAEFVKVKHGSTVYVVTAVL